MTRAEFSEKLQLAFAANDLKDCLDAQKTEQFYALSVEMLRVNEQMNLTAVTDPAQIIVKHYCDCALAAAILPSGENIADIGAGAGFPTLPFAILRQDVSILAVDSTAKRMDYVKTTSALLGLQNVNTLVARAEAMGKEPQYRESFALVCARAVARMPVLCEWCLPLVRPNGVFLAMKAKQGLAEYREAQNAIRVLGGREREPIKRMLTDPFLPPDHPDRLLSRYLLLCEKVGKTPALYPRNNAQIAKKPL